MAKNVARPNKVFYISPQFFVFYKSNSKLTACAQKGILSPTNTRAPEREKLGFFYFNKVKKLSYDKQPLALPEQVEHLRQKGVVISNADHAETVLRRVGLYRFKGYLLPHKTADGYANLTFEDAEALMALDEALRLHILQAMPLVEVGIRQAINGYMLERYGVRWYADPALFSDPNEHFDHAQFVANVLEGFHGLPDLFVGHYREKYDQSQPPPAWMITETMTLGSWSRLFEALGDREHRNRIAEPLGLNGKTLTSWLHALTIVRNVCAHHSRLYDRQFNTITISENRRTSRLLLEHSFTSKEAEDVRLRLAPRLYALHRLTHALDPRTEWTHGLKRVLSSAPPATLARVGLRAGWDTQPQWA